MRNINSKFNRLKISNTFVNASFIYILANGIGQGTTLLVNTFFTRYMTKSDYGLYSNYYSMVPVLVPIIGLNLYDGLANAYIDYKKDEIHDFRSSLLLLSIIWGSILSCLIIGFKVVVGGSMPLIAVVMALIHAYGFFAVNYYLQSMNMENQFIKKGIGLCVPNILQALLGIIAVMLCNNYISRAVGSATGIAVCGAFGMAVICKVSQPRYNREYWKYALKISLPAIISSLAMMIMQQCDKMMITEMAGSEITAVYALIYNIGYILYAVQQATSGVWQVWYYNTLEKRAYGNIPLVQKWYVFIMFVFATGLYMVAPEIIKILSPSSYWHFEYVPPFIIGSYLMLMYSLYLSTAQYNKKTGVVSWIVSLAAIINVLLNYILIPRFGGIAAAYTTVVSYLFIFVVSGVYLIARKQYYFKLRYFAVLGMGVLLMGIMFYFVRNFLLIRYSIFTVILVFELLYIYAKEKELKTLLARNPLKE